LKRLQAGPDAPGCGPRGKQVHGSLRGCAGTKSKHCPRIHIHGPRPAVTGVSEKSPDRTMVEGMTGHPHRLPAHYNGVATASERSRQEPFHMTRATFATRWNLDLIEAQFQRWRADPASVEESWRVFFEGFELGQAQAPTAADTAQAAQFGVIRLIDAYRDLGHLLAHLDPLSEQRTSHPLLELSEF